MPWFKSDDQFPQHPKVLAIPRRERIAAVGLWSLAGMWCAGQLTDGFVPDYMLDEFGATKKNAQQLVTVGLWETTEAGYQFHDWADWQPTKAQVEAERAAARERMQRARSGRVRPNSARTTLNEQGTSSEVRLTPSRPVPTSTSSDEEVRPAAKPLRAVEDEPKNAGQIIELWINSLPRRPPGSVIGQIGKQVKALLSEKFTEQEVIDGLNAWQAKGVHPSVLPSLVHEMTTKRQAPASGPAVEITPGYSRQQYTDEVRYGKGWG